MVRLSGCAALVGLALGVVLSPQAVSAGGGGDEVLYGRPLPQGELGVACFVRHYDRAHLAAHPEQHVTDMVALAYRQDGPGTPESVFNMTLRFRNIPGDQQFPGVCQPATGSQRLACGVECDGGSFAVSGSGETSILVDISGGIGSCDGEMPAGAGFGRDDKIFRLDRTDIAACRDLMWDDEMRPRLLE